MIIFPPANKTWKHQDSRGLKTGIESALARCQGTLGWANLSGQMDKTGLVAGDIRVADLRCLAIACLAHFISFYPVAGMTNVGGIPAIGKSLLLANPQNPIDFKKELDRYELASAPFRAFNTVINGIFQNHISTILDTLPSSFSTLDGQIYEPPTAVSGYNPTKVGIVILPEDITGAITAGLAISAVIVVTPELIDRELATNNLRKQLLRMMADILGGASNEAPKVVALNELSSELASKEKLALSPPVQPPTSPIGAPVPASLSIGTLALVGLLGLGALFLVKGK